MARKSKRQRLVKKLDEACKQIVRLRDGWCCQYCGKPVKGQNAHAAHIYAKSGGYALRWDLLDILLLCFHCHIQKFHRNPAGIPGGAEAWFANKYPARHEYLQTIRYKTVKYTDDDLEQMLAKRQEKLKELGDG